MQTTKYNQTPEKKKSLKDSHCKQQQKTKITCTWPFLWKQNQYNIINFYLLSHSNIKKTNINCQYCIFVSNCENMKQQAPIICYDFLLCFKTVLKIKARFKIRKGCFSPIDADINSLRLLRNLQYFLVKER